MKRRTENHNNYLNKNALREVQQMRLQGQLETLQSLWRRAQSVYGDSADLFIQQRMQQANQK